MRVAAIGECMIEFYRRSDGLYVRTFGGDTLNAAIYLVRLDVPVDYVTALGDDSYSDEMIAAWAAEGVGSSLVARLPGRLPGLYVIDVDERGERSFSYWRSVAPVRELFDPPAAAEFAKRLMKHSLVYLSGITLSLFNDHGRARLFGVLDEVRAHGVQVAFDGNFHSRGWPDPAVARQVFTDMLARTDIALPTFSDEAMLFGDADPEVTASRLEACGCTEIVVKRGTEACLVVSRQARHWVSVEKAVEPVDTTAAGDSFNTGYLAARLHGLDPLTAARWGHRLAGTVVCHRGAIIPRTAMPSIEDLRPAAQTQKAIS
jgi:2-dehydro-3-deoxygluconokinase